MKNPLILALLLFFSTQHAFSQNDACANATTLNVTPDSVQTVGTLYNVARTNAGTGGCGDRADVWYRFTVPPLTTSITINVLLTGGTSQLNTGNTYVELFTGNTCTLPSTSTGGCNTISASRTYQVTAGAIYLFRVYTTATVTNTPASAYGFTVSVTANDNCVTAATVPPGSTLDGNLRGASATGSIPTGCGGTPDDDVWYKFTAVLDYATISLSNIGGDLTTGVPRIQVFSGGACGSLSSLACGSTTVNLTGLTVGAVYYCRVYSNATNQAGTNYGFRFSVMPSALTKVTGSRMKEVYNQQIISSPQLLADPWEITYGPDNHLWVTESKGYKVYRVNPVTGIRDTILDISQNSTTSPDNTFRCQFNNGNGAQGGLAGMALHPRFLDGTNLYDFIYLSYIYSGSGNYFTNRLVRFTYNPTTKRLLAPVSLCDTLPGSNDHNSQRMIIAPVGGINYLFYAEGDMGSGQFGNAARPLKAQLLNSYEGKILRFNLESDGDAGLLDRWIPSTGTGNTTNPYNATLGVQSAVWSIGIRNNQGLAYDPILDKLYGSSHGPFSDDEINVIERGRNYGHPLIIGYAADGNVNGTTAGAAPGMSPNTGSCPPITDEKFSADSIGSAYRDPLFSAYPKSDLFPTIKGLWDAIPIAGNGDWPSEGWSGLDFYSNTVVPGWKRSLVASSLKWGRLVRIRLDATGDSAAHKSKANNTVKQDTVSYFGSVNRFRDVAFAPNGKDIYVVMDRSISTSGPSALYPVVPACQGCIQKYSFLGYETVAGQSSIDTSIDVTHGALNACNTGTPVTIDNTNNNLWVPITGPDGNIMAEIFPESKNLGLVTSSFYKNSGPLRMRNGSTYADRNITINPANTFSGTVKVRIYLSKDEYNAFDSNPLSGITSLSDLRIHKNSDPCQNAIAAATSIINPTIKTDHGDSAYVLQADISGFSTFYIGSTNVLLPLTSLNFNGKYKDEASHLKWETTNESNTDHFELERHIGDGVFINIGEIAAKGSNNTKTGYTYEDYEASKLGTSRLYYRLKVTDKDGSYTYSNVVVVDIPGSFITRISIFPNPADKQTTVLISSPAEQKITWQLVDVSGRTIMTKEAVIKKGENRIAVDMSNLRTGVYFIQVKGQFVNAQQKIQKL